MWESGRECKRKGERFPDFRGERSETSASGPGLRDEDVAGAPNDEDGPRPWRDGCDKGAAAANGRGSAGRAAIQGPAALRFVQRRAISRGEIAGRILIILMNGSEPTRN